MSNPPELSIVVPVHNETENVAWLNTKIMEHMRLTKHSYEIIYVDDGSVDGSLKIIKNLARKHRVVRYTSFSRNFGKEAATSAGLKRSLGNATIVMDADGQHPIELIETFIERWKDGCDMVIGVRSEHGEKRVIKRIGSRLFYLLLKLINSKDSSTYGLTDFRLIDRKVVDEYNKLSERNRVTRSLLDWLGFSSSFVEFTAHERHAGVASYSMKKLTKLAMDGIVKHSTRPLKLIGLAGIIISFLTGLLTLFITVEAYLLGDPLQLHISGTAFLGVFLSFMVGIVLVCQGLLALYLENVFYETQNRPLYVVREEG